jgi:L-ascorbate metabolism protein UlaG (beta-lactamase superfamily)
MKQQSYGYKNRQRAQGHPSAAVTYVGHATVYVEMDGVAMVTDPLLRDRVWHLRREAPERVNSLQTVEDLSAVLISHLDPDHADIASLRLIPSDVPLIAPRGTGGYLRARLPHPVLTVPVGDSFRIGSVEVTAVAADHRGSVSSLVPISTCLGFVLSGSKTIYFAGDTALFPGMTELGEAFDIDLSLLPVWGWGPSLSNGHLTPQAAASSLTMLRPRMAVPIHWGTFRPLGRWWSRMSYFTHPPYTFADHAARLAPDTDVRILSPGESMTF